MQTNHQNSTYSFSILQRGQTNKVIILIVGTAKNAMKIGQLTKFSLRPKHEQLTPMIANITFLKTVVILKPY